MAMEGDIDFCSPRKETKKPSLKKLAMRAIKIYQWGGFGSLSNYMLVLPDHTVIRIYELLINEFNKGDIVIRLLLGDLVGSEELSIEQKIITIKEAIVRLPKELRNLFAIESICSQEFFNLLSIADQVIQTYDNYGEAAMNELLLNLRSSLNYTYGENYIQRIYCALVALFRADIIVYRWAKQFAVSRDINEILSELSSFPKEIYCSLASFFARSINVNLNKNHKMARLFDYLVLELLRNTDFVWLNIFGKAFKRGPCLLSKCIEKVLDQRIWHGAKHFKTMTKEEQSLAIDWLEIPKQHIELIADLIFVIQTDKELEKEMLVLQIHDLENDQLCKIIFYCMIVYHDVAEESAESAFVNLIWPKESKDDTIDFLMSEKLAEYFNIRIQC